MAHREVCDLCGRLARVGCDTQFAIDKDRYMTISASVYKRPKPVKLTKDEECTKEIMPYFSFDVSGSRSSAKQLTLCNECWVAVFKQLIEAVSIKESISSLYLEGGDLDE